MKTATKILKLLPAIVIITACYLRVFPLAISLGAALPAALGTALAPKGARIFLPAHHSIEIFSKFPSSDVMSALPNFECEAESGFWHSCRISGRQGGDYNDHILSDNKAFVHYNDHILADNDHYLPYLEYPLHSGDECAIRGSAKCQLTGAKGGNFGLPKA